jgi:hypothetical protein
MKIYTYYEDIQFQQQEKMLELWQISWRNAGFEPKILCREDAKQSSFYEEFVDKIKNIYLTIMKKEISDYGLSCYLRWLAYSVQKNEYFYVSDYDCVNNGLESFIETDKLHLMDYACPCFASGKPDHFEKLCHLFIDISLDRITEIMLAINNFVWYHDQEFFAINMTHPYNKNKKELLEVNNIIMTRDLINGIGPFNINQKNTVKVLHISHDNIKNIKKITKEFDNKTVDEIRVLLMEKVIYEKDFILR